MHLSIEKMKIKISEKKIVTAAIRVNWFVACVNCANEDDCNWILFEVVRSKFVVNDIR
jgi:hypothetical protein